MANIGDSDDNDCWFEGWLIKFDWILSDDFKSFNIGFQNAIFLLIRRCDFNFCGIFFSITGIGIDSSRSSSSSSSSSRSSSSWFSGFSGFDKDDEDESDENCETEIVPDIIATVQKPAVKTLEQIKMEKKLFHDNYKLKSNLIKKDRKRKKLNQLNKRSKNEMWKV